MLKEIFALPIGLKQVTEINGIPLYGSQTLNDKFVQSIQVSKRGKLISKSIEELVKNNIIIPCFADSNILSHFRKRVSQNTSGGMMRILRILVGGKNPIVHPLDLMVAFYDFQNNKIIILISNQLSDRFGTMGSDEAIALSLTHELMHMFAHQNPNRFLSLFKEELNSYYKSYYTNIFKLREDKNLDSIIEMIYKYLFLKCEMTSAVSLMGIYTQLQKLKPYSDLNKDEFKTISIDYIRVTRLLLTDDMNKFIAEVKVKYKHIVKPFYLSYRECFKRIPNKGCAQEIVYPSEVICGYSDIKISPKVKTAIQSLV